MEKRRYSGRFLLVLGALALAGWAGYEFMVRVEMLWWTVKGLWNALNQDLIQVITTLLKFDWSMYELTGYLLFCCLFSILTFCLRNRPKAGYFLILLDTLLIVVGGPILHLFGLSITNWMQSLKLIPLLLVLVGCVVNLAQYYADRRRRRARRRRRWEDEEYEDRPSNRDMARQVRSRRKYPEAG